MLVFYVILAFLHLSSGEDENDHQINFHKFKGCRFDRFEGNRTCLNRYFVSDLINNNPRPCDHLKLRMYFTDRRPIICIHNEDKQITFGFYRNSSTFGIFKSHQDWELGETPCAVQGNVHLFSENLYTEVDMTLGKDGRFTVFVYGEVASFVLSCKLCYNLNPSNIIIRLGYNKRKGPGDIFFDCPFD
ncbi:hypothetical protein ACFFRR_011191 [Megaselia abdita]